MTAAAPALVAGLTFVAELPRRLVCQRRSRRASSDERSDDEDERLQAD
jgi:hypothetical protein